MWRKLTQASLLVVGAFAASGCLFVEDDAYYDDPYHGDSYGYDTDVVYTTIDADHVLDTELGEGAGVFVEYTSGGTWLLWTSCDTLITGNTCSWDIAVRSYSAIDALADSDLEAYDRVEVLSGNAFNFYSETYSHSDAVEFGTLPGEQIEIDVILDGYRGNNYLVWYGDGYVHPGAVGGPVVFEPDTP